MARMRNPLMGGEDEQRGGGMELGQFGGGPPMVPAPGPFDNNQFPLGGGPDGQPIDYANADKIAGRGETTGREEGLARMRGPSGAGGGDIAPRRPSEPTSMAGTSQMIGPSQGPQPFAPMGMPPTSRLARPQGGLYGSAGGLQGGGLGVPFDPTSDVESDPISTLLQLLMQGGKV